MSEERELRAALERAQGRVKVLEARVAELDAELADALDANEAFATAEVGLRQRIDELERPSPGAGRELATLKARILGMDTAHRTAAARADALQREREQWISRLEHLGHQDLLMRLLDTATPPLPTRQELLAENEALRTKLAAVEREARSHEG